MYFTPSVTSFVCNLLDFFSCQNKEIKVLQVTTKSCAFLIALFLFDYKRLVQPTKLLFSLKLITS